MSRISFFVKAALFGASANLIADHFFSHKITVKCFYDDPVNCNREKEIIVASLNKKPSLKGSGLIIKGLQESLKGCLDSNAHNRTWETRRKPHRYI